MNLDRTGAAPRGTLVFLIATAFLGALGIGLVNPVVPFLAARFVTERDLALAVGVLSMSYAGAAFLAAPALGALSDRFGRRPILISSVLGSALGYLCFGAAHAAWMLVLGRLIDGITAGNFSAVFASLSDSTKPEDRGRVFGYVGASFGSGFIVGPAIGGPLSRFGLSAPFYFAAGLCFANALFGFFFMPETRPASAARTPVRLARLNPFTQLGELLAMPALRPLLVTSVLFALPFAMMTTLLALLTKDALSWTPTRASTLFVAVGVSDVCVQGFALGRLLKLVGERRAALGGLGLAIFGLAGMALTNTWPHAALLLPAVVAFAVGEGIFTACLSALLSIAAGPDSQGRVHGGGQGLQSLTQMVGPMLGGVLYARISGAAPFALGAALLLVTALLFARATATVPETTAELS